MKTELQCGIVTRVNRGLHEVYIVHSDNETMHNYVAYIRYVNECNLCFNTLTSTVEMECMYPAATALVAVLYSSTSRFHAIQASQCLTFLARFAKQVFFCWTYLLVCTYSVFVNDGLPVCLC